MRSRVALRPLSLCFILGCSGASKPAAVPSEPAAHVREEVVINLFDAFGRSIPGTTKGWGYSAIVRHRGKTILFDAGGNADILAANAKALGVDLRDVDIAVLSHDHPDHNSGFDYLFSMNPRVVLYAPDDGDLGSDFDIRVNGPDPSLPPLPKERQYWDGTTTTMRTHMSGRYWVARQRVRFVKESAEVLPGITLVATTSPSTGEFFAYPPHESQPLLEGLPELSLVLDTAEGDVVFVGCSHSGVENIVRAVRELRKRPIDLLTGGFHLLPYPATTLSALSDRLRDEYGVKRVAPAHCTGHLGFQLLERSFGERFIVSGLGAEVPIRP